MMTLWEYVNTVSMTKENWDWFFGTLWVLGFILCITGSLYFVTGKRK